MRTLPRPAPGRPLPGPRSVVALVAGGLLALAVPASVLAHASLVSSDPADGAAVPFPSAITLTFDDALDAAKSQFLVVGADGSTAATGHVTADIKVMSATGLSLAWGAYQVRWTAVASDGDLTRGIVSFQVIQSGALSIEPSAAASAAAPTAAASPAASAAPSPSADGSVQAASSDVVLPIVVALVLVAGVGLYVLRRSRRA